MPVAISTALLLQQAPARAKPASAASSAPLSRPTLLLGCTSCAGCGRCGRRRAARAARCTRAAAGAAAGTAVAAAPPAVPETRSSKDSAEMRYLAQRALHVTQHFPTALGVDGERPAACVRYAPFVAGHTF